MEAVYIMDTGRIGCLACGVLAVLFFVTGVLFAIFKEKASKFVSGFHSLPEEEQGLYDKAYISRDMRNQCFTWSAIMMIGAASSYFAAPYMSIPVFAIWLILFFKNVHLDSHKAFEKYLRR